MCMCCVCWVLNFSSQKIEFFSLNMQQDARDLASWTSKKISTFLFVLYLLSSWSSRGMGRGCLWVTIISIDMSWPNSLLRFLIGDWTSILCSFPNWVLRRRTSIALEVRMWPDMPTAAHNFPCESWHVNPAKHKYRKNPSISFDKTLFVPTIHYLNTLLLMAFQCWFGPIVMFIFDQIVRIEYRFIIICQWNEINKMNESQQSSIIGW